MTYQGHEVDTTGDGFLATFDGPGRAIECASAIHRAVQPLGIDVRIGVHTGECELLDGGYAGMAVHIGARVAGGCRRRRNPGVKNRQGSRGRITVRIRRTG